jgi:hypothetical protein
LHQRGAPSLAQGGAGSHPRPAAGAAGAARGGEPRGESAVLGTVAGRAERPHHPTRGPAAAPDAAHPGQPDRALHSRLRPLAVRAWHHAALHSAWRQLAEHGGIHPADPQAPRVGRPSSTDTGGDHCLARGGRLWVEPGADALSLGRQAAGTAGASEAQTASCRRLRGLHSPTAPSVPSGTKQWPRAIQLAH